MVTFHINRDITIAIIFTLIGAIFGIIAGIYISEHFYSKNVEDFREGLIDGFIIDIAKLSDKYTYPEFYDSVTYSNDKKPWLRLTTYGVEKLFGNMNHFKDKKHFEDFATNVNIYKKHIDRFNDMITMRNLSISTSPKIVALYNPYIYNYFHSDVQPRADNLLRFLKENRQELISD